LAELGTLQTIGEVGRRDLRKLVRRGHTGVGKHATLDLEDCAAILIKEEMRLAVESTRGTELVHWMLQYARLGEDEKAIAIAKNYLEASGLREAPLDKGKKREIETETKESENAESGEAVAVETELDETEELTTAASPDARLLVPTFLPDLLILLAHLTAKREGHARSMIPLMRQLPMPDRTKLWIYSRVRSEKLLANAQREDDGRKSASQLAEELTPDVYALELAWGLDRPQDQVRSNPLARLFGDLFAKGNFNAALGLLDALIDGTQGPQPWLWVNGLPRPDAVPASATKPDVDDYVWATLLSGSLTKGKEDTASKVWSHLVSLGIKPSQQVYNALLKGYAQLGKWDALESVWNELTAQTGPSAGPDVYCYTTMISALFQSRRLDDAMDLFEEYKTKAASAERSGNSQGASSIVTYNAVLFGLLKGNRDAQAKALLAAMLSPMKPASVPGPNTSTLNTMLRAYARVGNLTALTDLLTTSQSWNVIPDVITYTTVLDALIRHGAPGSSARAVSAVHGMMKANNINMTPVTWTVLLKGLLRDSSTSTNEVGHEALPSDVAALQTKREQIATGLALVSEMVKTGHRPNEVTWTALIQSGCDLQRIIDEGDLATSKGDNGAPDIGLPQATSIGAELTPVAPLKESNRSVERLRTLRPGSFLTLSVLESMRRDYIQPNRKTYHFLLASLLRAIPGSAPSQEELEAARATFVRGLSVLDHFCAQLFTMTAAPPSAYNPLQQRSDSAPIRLRALVPPTVTSIGSRKSANPPPEPNDVSMRILLEALLWRFDALSSNAQPLRQTGNPSAATLLQEMEKDLELTRMVMQEALVRLRVVNLLRASRREGTGGDGASASLARMRERVEAIVSA
jgi:pentatricopeptide repeat protein